MYSYFIVYSRYDHQLDSLPAITYNIGKDLSNSVSIPSPCE
jgi:hypothetical protein